MADTTTGAAKRTDLDFEHFRQRLMEEKTLAESVIAGTKSQAEPDDMNQAGTQGAELSSQDENHPADMATELQLREQDMALVQNAKEILVQINHALQKLEAGTYGLSEHSGEVIPIERLEAVPYAVMTAHEQELQESA